jgi:long-chain acyl-CoA synthetase
MNITRLFDIPQFQKDNYPKSDAICAKENGAWRKYSIDECIQIINQVSHAFINYGLKKDDKISIISNNRAEWNFIDYGAMQAGIINVPVYPTSSQDDYEFIFNDAEVKMVFVSSEELFQKVKNVKPKIASILEVYTFNKVNDAKHWTEFFKIGEKQDEIALDKIKSSIVEDHLATIIYTSGTTGFPKGVMLTHRNVIADIKAAKPLMPVGKDHRALSFLPLNHSFEKLIIYLYNTYGVSVYYAESVETIGDNAREIKPHIFTAVPRLLEKVYEKIMAKGLELKGIKRALFFWAVGLGEKWDNQNPPGGLYQFQITIARKLIFSKWKQALGGEILMIVTGAAAMQQKLTRIFTAAGITIMEGYGLSETSPAATVNSYDLKNNKIGTVGKALPGVELKIASDGEILIRGEIIMKGYYKKPEQTAEVIDKEGWFHSGDIGEIDSDGFLKITDRKKELFKTSGGKYVAPQPIENKFKESFFIEQMMVVGDGKKYVSALIVPSFANLKSWAEKNNLKLNSNEELIAASAIKNKMQEVVDDCNKSFGHIEQVKKFTLLPLEWSIAGGEMTPKLSMKRKFIEKKYEKEIAAMYVD